MQKDITGVRTMQLLIKIIGSILMIIAASWLLTLCSTPGEGYIEQNVNAGDLFIDITTNPALKQNNNGEPFAWHACNGADLFVKGYKAWHDTSWLNNAVKYYGFLLDNMKAAPDGYRGLIGKNFRHKFWGNEQVSDALAVNPMLEFSELVLNDPELSSIYGDEAKEYVEFAKEHVIEKWDKRRLWHEEGAYGDYIFGSDFIDPDDPAKWVNDTTCRNSGMICLHDLFYF